MAHKRGFLSHAITLSAAMGVAALICAVASPRPAMADGWEHDDDDDQGGHYYTPGYVYYPPPPVVYYAPTPVYVAPPPPVVYPAPAPVYYGPPSLNFGITIPLK